MPVIDFLSFRSSEPLDTTYHPCTKSHLYWLITLGRSQMAKAANERAIAVVNKVINVNSSSGDTTMSSLTPLLSTNNNESNPNHGDVTRKVLTRGEERALLTRDKKTICAIEEGVEDGVGLLLSLVSSSLSNNNITNITQKHPCQTAKQAAHYCALLNFTKGDMKQRFSAALKYGTKLCVPGKGLLCKIVCEVNTIDNLEGKWRHSYETVCKYTNPRHPEHVNSSWMKQGPKPSPLKVIVN